jgi:hypothetical protein
VRAVAACALWTLLSRLPRDATGVAGLADAGLALPVQVAASQRVANMFLLCLRGAARGGDLRRGPLFLRRRRRDNPLYYIPVQGVAGNQARVPATCP